MRKKTVYIGSMYIIAEYLFHHNYFELEGIICEADRMNDNLLTFSLVRDVKIYKVNKENRIENIIKRYDRDTVFVMCSFGMRVPMEELNGYRVFNIHYAELPYYKGRHPSFWATVNNEIKLGISLHIVTKEFDRGDVVAQRMVPYYLMEDEEIIFDKLTAEVPRLLDALSNHLETGEIFLTNSDGMYFPPVKMEDIVLDLENDNPARLYNKVRSQKRADGAIVEICEKRFRIYSMVFSEKRMEDPYSIENNMLFLRYNQDVCLCCGKYREEE